MADLHAYRAREKAIRNIREIVEDGRNLFLIHYNCESLEKQDDNSPRVASISIRNFATEESRSFSLHMVRERLFPNINVAKLTSKNLDEMERAMLEEYFRHMTHLKEVNWVHWKMTSENFGFAAIEHRASVLGIENIVEVPFRHRHDLSRIVESVYGKGYAAHPRWRTLTEMNGITATDAVWNSRDNPAEVELFAKREFRLLQNSAIRKTSILRQLASLTATNQLRTDSNLDDLLASRLLSTFERARSNPWFAFLVFCFSIIGFIATIWRLASFVF